MIVLIYIVDEKLAIMEGWLPVGLFALIFQQVESVYLTLLLFVNRLAHKAVVKLLCTFVKLQDFEIEAKRS